MGRGFLCLLCTSLLVSSLWGSQKLQSRMTNQDVIELVSLGFSDGVIIDKIRTAQGSDFDTSIPALEELKAAKVSDVVIRAMIGETQWNRSCVSARSSDADRRPSREPNRRPAALEHRPDHSTAAA